MPESSNYYTWNKGEVYYLGEGQFFKTSEFTCHCSFKTCKEQRISKDLVSKLINLRKEINEPITINSAYRCTPYQAKLRAEGVNTVVAKKSTHESGDAVDCKPARMKIPQFLVFAAKYFYAIGIAKTFLHVDMRGIEEKQVRRWDY